MVWPCRSGVSCIPVVEDLAQNDSVYELPRIVATSTWYSCACHGLLGLAVTTVTDSEVVPSGAVEVSSWWGGVPQTPGSQRRFQAVKPDSNDPFCSRLAGKASAPASVPSSAPVS